MRLIRRSRITLEGLERIVLAAALAFSVPGAVAVYGSRELHLHVVRESFKDGHALLVGWRRPNDLVSAGVEVCVAEATGARAMRDHLRALGAAVLKAVQEGDDLARVTPDSMSVRGSAARRGAAVLHFAGRVPMGVHVIARASLGTMAPMGSAHGQRPSAVNLDGQAIVVAMGGLGAMGAMGAPSSRGSAHGHHVITRGRPWAAPTS